MTPQEAFSEDLNRVFEAIDGMVERVERFKVDPQFAAEVKNRDNRRPDFALNDERILERLIELIAFSNNARSEGVDTLVQRQVFRLIFRDYSVENAATFAHEEIVREHWPEIKAIRFKRKVRAMVRCAACLLEIRNRYGSFIGYLSTAGLPRVVRSDADIRAFWNSFRQIQAYLREMKVPYFGNLTSLCHLLLDLGFDVAKPDSAVMEASVSLGIVAPARTYPPKNLERTVRTVQRYAITRGKRVPVIDLYFLVKGGQSWARQFVSEDFYRL